MNRPPKKLNTTLAAALALAAMGGAAMGGVQGLGMGSSQSPIEAHLYQKTRRGTFGMGGAGLQAAPNPFYAPTRSQKLKARRRLRAAKGGKS